MSKFSLNLPEELDKYVELACFLSGRSRNAACVDWILRGALDELARFEKAEATLKSLGGNPISTLSEHLSSNGNAKPEVPPATPEDSPVDTPSTTKEPKYEDGTVIKIIKVPKSMKNRNLLNENGIVHRPAGKGKYLIHLADGTEVELPEAYIEPEKNVR